ncbi:MAG: pantothenate synthetase, partial [Chitinophagaceae bacterium]
MQTLFLTMIICKTETALQLLLKNKNQQPIGFVPTMGALHKGHIALIEESKKQTSITVCSIFINPTQFNDKKDFEKYPVTIESDILQLEQAHCDILFLPSVEEIYPNGLSNLAQYNLGFLEEILEGKYRANHFQGVCNVVERLLRIVQPHTLFLGQKDYQQCMVIAQLIHLMQWQHTLKLVIVPTIREASGLAMSSRNSRLSTDDKQKATAIYKALQVIQDNYKKQSFPSLQKAAEGILFNSGFNKIDYISICNADNLQPIESYSTSEKHVALIAAYFGDVRL